MLVLEGGRVGSIDFWVEIGCSRVAGVPAPASLVLAGFCSCTGRDPTRVWSVRRGCGREA